MKTLFLLASLWVGQVGFADDNTSEAHGHRARAQGHKPGIVGEVWINACPVITPFPCPNEPHQGTIWIFNERGRLVEEVVSDVDGSFVVFLKPGIYKFVPQKPVGWRAAWPSAAPVDVVVKPGMFVPVSIVYSTDAV